MNCQGWEKVGYLSDDVLAVGDGSLASDELQHHHAEAVDVALVSELLGHVVVRVEVTWRAFHDGGDIVGSDALHIRHRCQAGQTEVCHFGHLAVVQQYVAGLDISMEYGRVGFCVQVENSSCCP